MFIRYKWPTIVTKGGMSRLSYINIMLLCSRAVLALVGMTGGSSGNRLA